MSELHTADRKKRVGVPGSLNESSPTLVDPSEAVTSTCGSEDTDSEYEDRVAFKQKNEYTQDWVEAQKAKENFDDCVEEVNTLLRTIDPATSTQTPPRNESDAHTPSIRAEKRPETPGQREYEHEPEAEGSTTEKGALKSVIRRCVHFFMIP